MFFQDILFLIIKKIVDYSDRIKICCHDSSEQ